MSTKPLSTQLFHLLTPRDSDAVWRVLTPRNGEASFYGPPIVSDWQVGSPVELGSRVGASVVGEVIVAEPGARLTHTFGDEPDQPSVYVTWTLHADPSGTVIRLYVDELGVDSTDEDVERAWLPVLRALQNQLERLDVNQ